MLHCGHVADVIDADVIELSVAILTAGAWPLRTLPPPAAAPSMAAPRWGWARDLEEQFTHLYASHHSSRKLAWAPHLSTAEVATTYLAGGEQATSSAPRNFALLLCFNGAATTRPLSYLLASSGLSAPQLLRALDTLLAAALLRCDASNDALALASGASDGGRGPSGPELVAAALVRRVPPPLALRGAARRRARVVRGRGAPRRAAPPPSESQGGGAHMTQAARRRPRRSAQRTLPRRRGARSARSGRRWTRNISRGRAAEGVGVGPRTVRRTHRPGEGAAGTSTTTWTTGGAPTRRGRRAVEARVRARSPIVRQRVRTARSRGHRAARVSPDTRVRAEQARG